MPYKSHWDGLYLLRQRGGGKSVSHFGILIAGRWIGREYVDRSRPMVVHQAPPGITMIPFEEAAWEVLGQITDERSATLRMLEAARTPNYDLFGNNCEHFANYVARGRRESPQLQAAVLAVVLIGVVVWASS